MNRKRKKLFLGLGIVVFLGIAALTGYVFTREDKKETPIIQSSNQSTEEESSSATTKTEQTQEPTENQKNHQKALSTLEYSDQPASDSLKADVINALIAAQNYVRSIDQVDQLKGDSDNHMLMTTSGMMQSFWIVLKFGNYSVDSSGVEVFKSKHSDVIQFVCKLTSAGKDDCYFVGNYNIYAKQLQFGSYHGGQVDASFG